MKLARKLTCEEWLLGRVKLATAVQKSLEKSSGTLGLFQLDLEVMRGEQTVFGLFNDSELVCLVVGKHVVYHNEMRGFFVLLAAGELTKHTDLVDEMYAIVKAEGAQFVEAWAGTPEAKLYSRVGFEPTRIVLRKQL